MGDNHIDSICDIYGLTRVGGPIVEQANVLTATP